MILGGASYTPLVVMRGDIGASLMETREVKSKILLAKSILDGENELLKEILRKVRNKENNNWNVHLRKSLNRAGMVWDDVQELNKENIKKKINQTDTDKWKAELEKKTTLGLYRKFKKEMKEEAIYDNRYSTKLLFWARSNSLDLNDGPRNRGEGAREEDKICTMCGAEKEDVEHFVLRCRNLFYRRDEELTERLKGENDEETLGNLMFKTVGKDLEALKEMLQKLWDTRKTLLSAAEGGERRN